jgi:hypothetical protein
MRLRRATGWEGPAALDALGLGALAALAVFAQTFDEFQPFVYQGGLALVALATVAVIAAVVHPSARLLPGLLERQPLSWIGLRSYGIYLWHWPVFALTRPQLDVPLQGLTLLGLRLAVTMVLVELSYRFVEMPVRGGAIGRAVAAARRSKSTWREARWPRRVWLGVKWAGGIGGVVVCAAALGFAVASARPPAPPSYLSVEAVHSGPPPGSGSTVSAASLRVAASAQTQSSQPPNPLSESAAVPAADVPMAAAAAEPTISPGAHVTAIGDSVMVGAAAELERAIDGVEVDAAIGRQASTAIGLLRARRDAGELGSVVIVHIGSNGTFTAKQFDEMMAVLEKVPRVVVVNVKVPREWEDENNSVLAEGARRYHNVVLVDWHGASDDHPELFWSDGIHLKPEGARLYARLLARSALSQP